MERDPTLVEVTLRLTPDALEACAILLEAEVESVEDLLADAKDDGASERFLAEMGAVRDHWRRLLLPLVEASKRLRDSRAVAGVIETKNGGDHG